LISEHSIGFQTMQSKEIQSYEEYQKNREKGWKEITQIKLWEGSSLSAWGANEMTPLTGMKDLKDKSEQIAKFCKDSSATDETIELLLLYNSQLVQTINDLQTKQPASDRITTLDVIDTITLVDGSHQPAIVPDEVKVSDTASCPGCHRHTKNTQSTKGYVRCHRCNKVFTTHGALSIII